MASKIIKLKTILAEAHLKTQEQSIALVNLEKTVRSLNVDDVLKHRISDEIEKCLDINYKIRELVKAEK